MNQREFWDAVAATKEFAHPFDGARFSALVEPSARILDYGCGYGRVCGELRAAGYGDVVGVDASPRMIERARAEHPDIRFHVPQGEAHSFADESFDAVILFSVLTCIPDDADQRALVGELARVLRPGGLIYVSDLLLQDDERNRARYDAYLAKSGAGLQACERRAKALRHTSEYALVHGDAFNRGVHGTFELEPGVVFRHLARPWIDELFAAFDCVEFVNVDVVTMNGNPARGFQYFGRAIAPRGEDA